LGYPFVGGLLEANAGEKHLVRLGKLRRRAAAKFGLRDILLHHRIGFVPVAEPSVVVRVSSSHRGPAFDASQWIMNELKRVVPIWKRPVFKEAASPAPA
jgi:molybdopterin synthase catalytic subunit